MKPLAEQPAHYCDPCQGVAPIAIGSTRDFVTGKGIIVAVALVVLLFAIR